MRGLEQIIASTYIGVNIDLLEDVLQNPPISSTTKFCQVCLLGRVDGDDGMVVWGDEEFMEIANWYSISARKTYRKFWGLVMGDPRPG